VDNIGEVFSRRLLEFYYSSPGVYVITFLLGSKSSFELARTFTDAIAKFGAIKDRVLLVGMPQHATLGETPEEASTRAAELEVQYVQYMKEVYVMKLFENLFRCSRWFITRTHNTRRGSQ
jgi:hypothetical protein